MHLPYPAGFQFRWLPSIHICSSVVLKSTETMFENWIISCKAHRSVLPRPVGRRHVVAPRAHWLAGWQPALPAGRLHCVNGRWVLHDFKGCIYDEHVQECCPCPSQFVGLQWHGVWTPISTHYSCAPTRNSAQLLLPSCVPTVCCCCCSTPPVACCTSGRIAAAFIAWPPDLNAAVVEQQVRLLIQIQIGIWL